MKIRLRNILAIGALSSGLLAGGALVANAATMSTTGQLRDLRHERDIECRDLGFVRDDPVVELEYGQFRLRDHGLGILGFDRFRHEFELRLDQELPEHGQRLGCSLGHAPVRVRLRPPVGLEQRVDVGSDTPASS